MEKGQFRKRGILAIVILFVVTNAASLPFFVLRSAAKPYLIPAVVIMTLPAIWAILCLRCPGCGAMQKNYVVKSCPKCNREL